MSVSEVLLYGNNEACERLMAIDFVVSVPHLNEANFMNRLLRSTSLLLLVAVGFLLAPLPSSAQTSLGILVGVVRDATGAVVPKVTLTITGNEDGIVRTVVTQGDGAYRIEALRPE